MAKMNEIQLESVEPFPGCRVLSSTEGSDMADRAGLGFVGFMLGGLTAAVMLMAVTVVIGHVDGRFVLETTPTQLAAHQ